MVIAFFKFIPHSTRKKTTSYFTMKAQILSPLLPSAPTHPKGSWCTESFMMIEPPALHRKIYPSTPTSLVMPKMPPTQLMKTYTLL